MKIFFDTEFLENGSTIELISIGMVREDGAEYYAETTKAVQLCMMSPWLQQNVQPHLRGGAAVRYKPDIGGDIVSFVGDAPEFWADYASYDWVALCQIYGTMLQLPKGWPMFVRDVQQLRAMHRLSDLPIPIPPNTRQHDALSDAWECRAKYDWLTQPVEQTA